MADILCPECESDETHYSNRMGSYECLRCGNIFDDPDDSEAGDTRIMRLEAMEEEE